MTRTLLTIPLLFLAACGVEAATSFAPSSPASTAAPTGHRVPVATVLRAADPAEAARSPLLAPAATSAPAMDHTHHHHHQGPPSAPAIDHSQHRHGAGGSEP